MHHRRFNAIAAVALAALFVTHVAAVPPVETISWNDLIPPRTAALEKQAAAMQQAFMELSAKDRDVYRTVAHELTVRDRLASGRATEGDLSVSDLEVLEQNASAEHADALTFWRDVKKLNTAMNAQQSAVVPDLDGRKVRVPGYVLPLEIAQAKVREFLLVPYVGACIHTPPPPANQMVYVKAPEGFESAGLYTPVWVEGTLFTHSDKYKVSFIDGNSDVDASYSLEATKVEKYEQ